MPDFIHCFYFSYYYSDYFLLNLLFCFAFFIFLLNRTLHGNESDIATKLKTSPLNYVGTGGTIGTGLLLASGGAVHSGGPGGGNIGGD
ncbi:hypothetical protein [Piscirickettsia salmonis]|uniref:hypothetical protein n=1 Tax=Piscirickettsia salmonis TaxID=1238 RepID=UPI000B0A88DC